jgi:type I restriction enzyme M protein
VSKLSGFVWSIADQLRGPYHQHEYGSVILPMTILRRLDAILEPHRAHIAELIAGVDSEMRQASLVRQATGLRFYNTSKFTLKTLLKDPDGLQANLTEYVHSFSSAIDVFERFKFDEVITSLAEKDRLYLVVERFTKVDLHPDTISNSDMGDLFEDLIRRFAEASNATAGDHFTPRDAVRLVVDLMFAEDNDALLDKGAVRTVYDPTAGTGGMLSLADEHLSGQNPDARLTLYGQEFNPQSYAICKSDLLAKGHNPDNIKLGDTLSDDKFPGQTFDYCLANPPYGVDWKASEKAVKDEYNRGFAGRFGPGLPGVGDGQMLFLLHLVSKMRPASQGGGRVGVVMNGSPLFNGGAGSGQSEIRRWLLEKDLVEAIVALPTDMFFNTGISTYVWVLDNTKSAERAGKVQLVDGSGRFTKMRKSLGSKRVEISDDDRAAILADYATFETSWTSATGPSPSNARCGSTSPAPPIASKSSARTPNSRAPTAPGSPTCSAVSARSSTTTATPLWGTSASTSARTVSASPRHNAERCGSPWANGMLPPMRSATPRESSNSIRSFATPRTSRSAGTAPRRPPMPTAPNA